MTAIEYHRLPQWSHGVLWEPVTALCAFPVPRLRSSEAPIGTKRIRSILKLKSSMVLARARELTGVLALKYTYDRQVYTYICSLQMVSKWHFYENYTEAFDFSGYPWLNPGRNDTRGLVSFRPPLGPWLLGEASWGYQPWNNQREATMVASVAEFYGLW